ncbi:hypothetical protein MIR68_003109 [Amoeboaphelidium protococcarum]|nr:hypothetical protein MIR68_003109 [Amoeboaphelidium protococcarum]
MQKLMTASSTRFARTSWRQTLNTQRWVKSGSQTASISESQSNVLNLRISDLRQDTEIDIPSDGQVMLRQVRVHAVRVTKRNCFIILRQGGETLQAIVSIDQTGSTASLYEQCLQLRIESIVNVRGRLVPLGNQQRIKACTVHGYELHATSVDIVSAPTVDKLPFSTADANIVDRIHLDTRLDNRVLDLRSSVNQAIFSIQHGVTQAFRSFMLQNDFIEIHTPKLISAASEGSGSSVFKVDYSFGQQSQSDEAPQSNTQQDGVNNSAATQQNTQNAFLAQSPQLYKQMMICADYERVFEIGPVFRAENSHTHRHLTEFTGLDFEMQLRGDDAVDEAVHMIDRLFRFIFTALDGEYKQQIDTVHRSFQSQAFQLSKETPILEHRDAVQMLLDAGVHMDPMDDFSTENERQLGRLVKDQFQTDFFMVKKFPLEVRPFYTMPYQHSDDKHHLYSLSYDAYMRGEEILSGAQRIHDYQMLADRAEKKRVDVNQIQSYMDAFRYGAPPHAGAGIGLERVVMLYLDLKNVRRSSLFPRDPKRISP